MDALFIIIALALIWRGPELAKLMDALWEEWTRPSADAYCGFRLPYATRGSDARAIERMTKDPRHECWPLWKRLLRRLVPVMLRKR